MSRLRRSGFSLLELLIGMLVVGLLVQVSLMLTQGLIEDTRRIRVQDDLEALSTSIQRIQKARSRPIPRRLGELVGVELAEVPADPWENDYFLDPDLGVVGSFGGDGEPLGDGPDRDVFRHLLPPMAVSNVVYEGSYGVPGRRSRLRIELSRPFTLIEGLEAWTAHEFRIWDETRQTVLVPGALGFEVDLQRSLPERGILYLSCTQPERNVERHALLSRMTLDFLPPLMSLAERVDPEGPLFEVAEHYQLGLQIHPGSSMGAALDRR